MDKAKFNPEEFGFEIGAFSYESGTEGNWWCLPVSYSHGYIDNIDTYIWWLEEVKNGYKIMKIIDSLKPGFCHYEGPIDTYCDAMELFEEVGLYG
jgi:catalase (peroxidase I)